MEKNTIIEVEKTLLNAMKDCDVNKLDELLHEELLFTIPNGETITKAMDLETYRLGNMTIDEITSSDQKINVIQDNAIVSVIIEMKGKFFDYPLDGKYKIIRIWKLVDNKLKVIAGSSIKLEENNDSSDKT
ncbi:nuclear transport factor 2 family protein [Kordia sp.]|uniref:nuclear transport factor 2 family protein n=1 Tax=Kordia sp. TaxID=1965332 RepID=UPI003B5A2FFE